MLKWDAARFVPNRVDPARRQNRGEYKVADVHQPAPLHLSRRELGERRLGCQLLAVDHGRPDRGRVGASVPGRVLHEETELEVTVPVGVVPREGNAVVDQPGAEVMPPRRLDRRVAVLLHHVGEDVRDDLQKTIGACSLIDRSELVILKF
jgi:hypothetical protein